MSHEPSSQTHLTFTETIRALRPLYRARRLRVESVVEALLDRIHHVDKSGAAINSILELNPDAVRIARQLDQLRPADAERLGLFGVPILLKDNINTHDRMTTTGGSHFLAGNVAAEDATVVRKLRDAGAVILGKTNMTEFAYDPHGLPSGRGGIVRNPYRLDRMTGGSSSGSAAAVAAGFAVASLGTDSSMSLRIPASHCGVVTLRPTFGLISRHGMMPLLPTQDTIGPIARTVEDVAAITTVLAGTDPKDPSTASADQHAMDYVRVLKDKGLKGRRIGVIADAERALNPQLVEIYRLALNDLRAAGADVREVDIAPFEGAFWPPEQAGIARMSKAVAMEAYLAGMTARSPVRSLRQLIATRLLSPVPTSTDATATGQDSLRFLGATDLRDPALIAEISTAEQRRLEALRRPFVEKMQELKVDMLFYVTANFEPRRIIDIARHGEPAEQSEQATRLDARTSARTHYLGLPEISIPAGSTESGIPVGVSFQGLPFAEADLLQVAYAFEQMRPRIAPPNLDQTAPQLEASLVKAPDNDDFAAATELSLEAGRGRLTGTTSFASIEVDEPKHPGRKHGRSVWYRITPSRAGRLTLDLQHIDDRSLVVFVGKQLPDLVPLTTTKAPTGSTITATLRKSRTYYLSIAASDRESVRRFSIDWAFAHEGVPSPP